MNTVILKNYFKPHKKKVKKLAQTWIYYFLPLQEKQLHAQTCDVSNPRYGRTAMKNND